MIVVVEAVDVDGVGGGCEGICYILHTPLLVDCDCNNWFEKRKGGRGGTSSTNSRTRSRIGSGASSVSFVAEGGRWRFSFWRERVTVLA